jgi:hypothetical protein
MKQLGEFRIISGLKRAQNLTRLKKSLSLCQTQVSITEYESWFLLTFSVIIEIEIWRSKLKNELKKHLSCFKSSFKTIKVKSRSKRPPNFKLVHIFELQRM